MEIIKLIDDNIYNLICKLMNINTTAIMIFISYLGSAITLIGLSIFFIIIFKEKKYSKLIILNLILVFILNIILKQIIARPRPNVLRLISEKGYSFPSGHAMITMAYYGFLGFLIYKNIGSKKLKYTLILFLYLLVVLIGISRIYLGVHYATDILGGFAIAIIYLIFFVKSIYNKVFTNNVKKLLVK